MSPLTSSNYGTLSEIFGLAWRLIKRPQMLFEGIYRNPLWLFQVPYYIRKLNAFQVGRSDFLMYLFPQVNPSEMQAHLNEVDNLVNNRQGFFSDFEPPKAGSISLDEGAVLYVLVRLLEPENVVETGPGMGMSSTFILAGLEANNKGHLYSIDLPKPKVAIRQGPDSSPGCLIPEQLRNRWTLLLGKSQERLLPLLKELNEIDLFFHDSLHYFHHQKFEYETVWPWIKRDGLLLTHDVSKPYFSLCQRLNVTPVKFHAMGGINKRSGA